MVTGTIKYILIPTHHVEMTGKVAKLSPETLMQLCQMENHDISEALCKAV